MRNLKGQFVKGHKETPFGHTRTRGRKHTLEAILKIKQSKLGKKRRKFNKQWIENMKEAVKKRHEQIEFGFKNGNKNPSWAGGIAVKYGRGFTPYLKNKIKERDGYICQLCFKNPKKVTLAIHHIDYDKENCKTENLITLCVGCNCKVNFGRSYWKNYFKQICILKAKI